MRTKRGIGATVKSRYFYNTEVEVAGIKAVRDNSDKETSTSKQIIEISKRSEEIFMAVFRHVVPRGDYYKKKKAEEIIRAEVPEKPLRKKMLRLLELIPEKKSLLLAQKELDDRNIKHIMKKFAELNVSPVTLSKRHEATELKSLYSYLD